MLRPLSISAVAVFLGDATSNKINLDTVDKRLLEIAVNEFKVR
jgi:hypothetical protein